MCVCVCARARVCTRIRDCMCGRESGRVRGGFSVTGRCDVTLTCTIKVKKNGAKFSIVTHLSFVGETFHNAYCVRLMLDS